MNLRHPKGCLLYCPDGGIYTIKFDLPKSLKLGLSVEDTTIKNADKKGKGYGFFESYLG